MNNDLKVSIITACYNSQDHIKDCLHSILSQTYPNIEHLIVDGGSKDATFDIVESHQPTYLESGGKTLQWKSEKDKGIYDALNKGIARATGDIIGIVHSDDLLADSHTIETIVATIQKGIDGVYGDMTFVEPADVETVKRTWRAGKQKSFQLGWSLPHQTLFLKKAVYEKFGGYLSHMTNAADYEFELRILKGDSRNEEGHLVHFPVLQPVKLTYIPQPLIIMKLGGTSTKDAGSSAKGYKEVFAGMKLHKMKIPMVANTLRLASKLKQRSR